jgi:hypothetical protein
MSAHDSSVLPGVDWTRQSGRETGVRPRPNAPAAVIAAFPLAVLIAIASVAGLAVPSLYARESANWAAQAVGQDCVDLVMGVPWLCITAVLALRGSRSGLLLLAGGLVYTFYTFVIYALGMHFNAMFLVYTGALGVSFFALVRLAPLLFGEEMNRRLAGPRASKIGGFFLIAIAVLFGGAWLSEIVPAIWLGTTPKSIVEAGTPTNPVHVIDLSVILPLHFAAGVALVRGRSYGWMLASVVLGFGVLMAQSIAGMMLVMHLRGIDVNLGVAAGMTVVSLATASVLAQLLRSVRTI